MVKLAVISDLHLGFKTGSERKEDAYSQAAKAFSKALSEDPDIIILLGDIFHKKIPSQETLGESISFFSELNRKFNKFVKIRKLKENKLVESGRIPSIVTIYGTHERRNPGKVNPVHILEKANLIHCLNKDSILIQINGQRIGLHGLSGVHDTFAKKELLDWNPKPFDKAFNLFLIHQTFNDIIPTNNSEFLEFKDLPEGFDMYLLGHIHWKIEEKHPITKKPILVPGSTIRTQLREIESKIEKGFYIINIVQDRIRTKFVPITTRPFFFEKIKIENQKPSEIVTNVTEKIDNILNKKPKDKALVKFKIEGKLAEGFLPADLQIKSLTKKYSDKLFLNIDTSNVTSSDLEKRESFLQKIMQRKESVESIGLQLLMNSLKSSDPIIEEIFTSLSEDDLERAKGLINQIKMK